MLSVCRARTRRDTPVGRYRNTTAVYHRLGARRDNTHDGPVGRQQKPIKKKKKHLSRKTLTWNTCSQKARLTTRVSSVFRYGAQCGIVLVLLFIAIIYVLLLLLLLRRVCVVTILFDRNSPRFNKFESTECQKNECVVFKRNSIRIHDFHCVFISYTSHNLTTKKYKLPRR